MNAIRKTVCVFLAALSVVLFFAVCKKTATPFTVGFTQIKKSGNVILDSTFDEMKANGIEVGDIITVTVADQTFELPVGTSYTDVDVGCMICRFDTEDNEITLAINMGSFASETGIGEKLTVDMDPGYQWNLFVTEVGIALKEKQGYRTEYDARNLTRTNARTDYADLSDEDFANFRAVKVTGIRENTLYRSSSPIDPDLERCEYAMQAMENAGIRSIINLCDSEAAMTAFEAYADSYYSQCSILNIEMGYDFTSAEFGEKVKACVGLDEITACLGEMGLALPDELLDAVAGGVTQDDFICAWLAREWELEQKWGIGPYDFEGQKRAQDQAWDDVVNTLGAPD